MKTEQQLRDEIARLKKLYADTGGYTKEPVSAKVAALKWVIAQPHDQSSCENCGWISGYPLTAK